MTAPPDSLVLVHGFASTFEHNWRQTGWVDILGDFGCEVPALDLPGHGSSPRPVEPEAYADVEGEVAAMLPRPTGAVGFSAGGEILLRIAIATPGAVDRLVVMGVGDTLFEPSGSEALVEALEADAEPDDVRARLFIRLARTTGNDPLALAAFLRRPREPLTEDDLGRVTCPVLVVLGDRDDIGSAERLVGALPSATLATVPGADHFSTPSDFGAIDATLEFLGLG
jgi:pimeloyl-ACP methyl ester carboxylesterase